MPLPKKTETEVVNDPPAPVDAPAVPKSKRWSISLPHNQPLEIVSEEPLTREEAIEKYKSHFGINSTVHEFGATVIEDAPAEG